MLTGDILWLVAADFLWVRAHWGVVLVVWVVAIVVVVKILKELLKESVKAIEQRLDDLQSESAAAQRHRSGGGEE